MNWMMSIVMTMMIMLMNPCEEWTEGQHEKMEDYVNIDSHILCAPVSLKYEVH